MRAILFWLLIPAVLLAEDVSLPTLVTIHVKNGRVFSAEPHGTPLPDPAVNALTQLKPPPKPETSVVVVPITMPVAEYRGSSREPCKAEPNISVTVKELNPAKALQLEGKLKPDNSSIDDRSALIRFAADNDDAQLQQMRYRQIAWMVEHAPATPVLCGHAAMISKIKAPKEYAEVRALWLKALGGNSPELNVLESGSNYLRVSDPEELHRILSPHMNELALIRIWLGEAYAFAAIGLTEMASGKPFVASAAPELPSTAFAISARNTLRQSGDLVLLTSALHGLKEAGTELKFGTGQPQGFAEFCSSIVARIRELKPNSEHDCIFPGDELPSAARSPDLHRVVQTKRVQPTYPQAAKAEHLGGTLVVHAVIDKQGKVRDVGYLSGPLVFYPETALAVRQWEYKPYVLGDSVVEFPTEIGVVFNLN